MSQLALNFSTRTFSQTQGVNLRRVRSGIAPHILEFLRRARSAIGSTTPTCGSLSPLKNVTAARLARPTGSCATWRRLA